MELNILESGTWDVRLDKEGLFMLQEKAMMDSGLTIEHMDTVHSNTRMVLFTLESGLRIFSKAKALRSGLAKRGTKESFMVVKRMASEKILGMMAVNTLVNGKTMRFQDLENTPGQAESPILDSGREANNMVTECLSGMMVENMRVNILMIYVKAMDTTHTPIRVSTQVLGSTIKILALVFTQLLMAIRNMVSGLMERNRKHLRKKRSRIF